MQSSRREVSGQRSYDDDEGICGKESLNRVLAQIANPCHLTVQPRCRCLIRIQEKSNEIRFNIDIKYEKSSGGNSKILNVSVLCS